MTAFDWDAEQGEATERQVTTTVPGGFERRNTTAEIAVSPCGQYLYVSNRGQDKIVLFAINSRTGLLTYAGAFAAGGKKPRFFALGPDRRHAYVANQDSDMIAVFHIDQPSGSLIPTGVRIEVGSPSAISFVAKT